MNDADQSVLRRASIENEEAVVRQWLASLESALHHRSKSAIANMWKRTPQEGLWFIAGGLGQFRIYSKYLALQIKAIEEGLLPTR